jgi:hypothetical protein
MIRHPLYLLVCTFAVGYLAIADVRGWSLLQTISRNLVARTGPSGIRGSSFNHK